MRYGILVVAAVVGLAGPLKADDAANDVVKKSIEATGGAEALNKYKAGQIKIEGNVQAMGLDVAFTGTATYDAPDKFKMAMSAELMGMKFAILQVYNGKEFVMTMNGMKVPLPDGTKEEMESNALSQEIQLLTPLLDAKKYTLKAAADADVNDSKTAVVVVSGKAVKDKEWKLFFDKKTNLLVKMQRKAMAEGNEVDEESVFSDFKKVSGVNSAHKVVVKHDGKDHMTYKVTEMKLMEKADPKEFTIDD